MQHAVGGTGTILSPQHERLQHSLPAAARPHSRQRCSGARRGAHAAAHRQRASRQHSSILRAVLEAPQRPVACEAHGLPPTAGFSSIPDALADIAAGKFVVVTDDADRENEGDLIMAADRMTEEAMAFMVEETSGWVCVGMRGADLDRLQLPLLVPPSENDEALRTAFAMPVDLAAGTTTGIDAHDRQGYGICVPVPCKDGLVLRIGVPCSFTMPVDAAAGTTTSIDAHDRAATCRALADPAAQAADFNRPGHVATLRAREGGVLNRRGHTEAAVDMAALAGRFPAGVLCEIVDRSTGADGRRRGSMARTPYLLDFAQRQGLRIVTIDDLAQYVRMQQQASGNGSGSGGGSGEVNTAVSGVGS